MSLGVIDINENVQNYSCKAPMWNGGLLVIAFGGGFDGQSQSSSQTVDRQKNLV